MNILLLNQNTRADITDLILTRAARCFAGNIADDLSPRRVACRTKIIGRRYADERVLCTPPPLSKPRWARTRVPGG